jgi:NAD(P)-dependent dehydrogenase (short-subunit alcohol dehydrogenase family)
VRLIEPERLFGCETSLTAPPWSPGGRAASGEGCAIELVDLDDGGMDRVASEIKSLGARAKTHVLDVTDVEAVGALAETVRPRVLVNCAGVVLLAEAENTSPEQWDRILDVNLRAPINICAAFLPSLKESGGHIINVASVDGLLAVPGSAAYSTSKFGLVGYSESLGAELACYGIGVTAVCPGFTWTPMVDTMAIGEMDRGKVDRLLRIARPLIFTTPEKLAASAIRAVKRNKPLLAHTLAARLVYAFKRISPRLYRDLFARPVYRIVRLLK